MQTIPVCAVQISRSVMRLRQPSESVHHGSQVYPEYVPDIVLLPNVFVATWHCPVPVRNLHHAGETT